MPTLAVLRPRFQSCSSQLSICRNLSLTAFEPLSAPTIIICFLLCNNSNLFMATVEDFQTVQVGVRTRGKANALAASIIANQKTSETSQTSQGSRTIAMPLTTSSSSDANKSSKKRARSSTTITSAPDRKSPSLKLENATVYLTY